jgi:hypothetical protein
MRYILLLIFAISFSTCFGQDEFKNLEKAYKKKSQSQYGQFLEQWRSESTPFISLDSLSNLQKDVYEIFIDFYNPFNLQRIGSGEWGNKLYSDIDYVIIQNRIIMYTYKTDSLNFGVFENTDSLVLSKDSITNFRPDIEFEEAKTLYLLPKYELVINKFLGSKSYPLGAGGIMNPSRAKGKSAKRLEFINKKLNIIHGHWGGYWHIETHPEVFTVDFNNDRTVANVHFRLVYQGGVAIYIRENGKWTLKDSHLTWIE